MMEKQGTGWGRMEEGRGGGQCPISAAELGMMMTFVFHNIKSKYDYICCRWKATLTLLIPAEGTG